MYRREVSAYRERLVDRVLDELLEDVPGVLLLGPRGVGKTTTLARRAGTVVRLDREGEAIAFRADPDAALRGLAEPILIDEWQIAPGVLAAIKRSIDADSRAGRFLVTGSVRARLREETWPGTGRLVSISMAAMSMREIVGRTAGASVIDRLAEGEQLEARDAPDLRGYVEQALASGFPEAVLRTPDRSRSRWLAAYVDQLVTRDAEMLAERRDPQRLRRYVEAYALCSAGVAPHSTLYDAAGINQRTAVGYEALLENLLIADPVPSWRSNRLKRLVEMPKRYLVDAGLLEGVLRLGVDGFLREGDLLGRLIDTFVTSQIRAELPLASRGARLHHLRTEQGRHEADLVIALPGQRVLGIEIKATASPGARDARHLRWLRDELGDHFVGGVVFHTGPRSFRLDERIQAAPIAAIWA